MLGSCRFAKGEEALVFGFSPVSLSGARMRWCQEEEEGAVLFNWVHSIGAGRRCGWFSQLAGDGSNVGGWQVMAVSGEGRQVGGSVRLAPPHGGVWPGVECAATRLAVSEP